MTPSPIARRAAAPASAACLAIGLLLAGCGTSTAPEGTGSTPTSDSTPSATDNTPSTTDATSPTSDATTDGATMTQTPEEPLGAGAVLTPEDDGATVRLMVGEEVSVQLAPPWDTAEPVSEDADVVEVVRVDHFTDPGYAEFTLLALGTGEARVQVQAEGEEIGIHLTVTD